MAYNLILEQECNLLVLPFPPSQVEMKEDSCILDFINVFSISHIYMHTDWFDKTQLEDAIARKAH